MTDDERAMLRGVTNLVEHMLGMLADGAGIADFEEALSQWRSQSMEIKQRLDEERRDRERAVNN